MNRLPSLIIVSGLLIWFMDGSTGFDTTLRRSCGKELTNRLASVCNNRFNGRESSNFPVSHRRVRRQVVNECCKQACIDATIKQYCMHLEESNSQENANEIPPQILWEKLKYTEIRVGTPAPELRNTGAPLYRPVYIYQ